MHSIELGWSLRMREQPQSNRSRRQVAMMRPGFEWKNRPLAVAFWSINVGLAAMVLLSILPVGLMQLWAAVEFGTGYLRSAEFLQTPLSIRLRWLRIFGDSLFAFGALVPGWFVLGLVTGHSFEKPEAVGSPIAESTRRRLLPESFTE